MAKPHRRLESQRQHASQLLSTAWPGSAYFLVLEEEAIRHIRTLFQNERNEQGRSQNSHVISRHLPLSSSPSGPRQSASSHYSVQFNPARQSLSVAIGLADGVRTRTFPIQPASHSDKALLTGALAQTFLLLNEQEIQIQLLQEQLTAANKQLFGASSEKKPCTPSVAEPVQNGNAAPEQEQESEQAADSADGNVLPFKRRGGRKPLPPQLPRSRQEHRLPPDAVCAHCQGTLRPLRPDITEQMIVVPARYEVIEHVRHKAVCRCCEAFTAAPMPKPMVEGSSYGSASFLAYIACNKYQLGLLYYRQEKLFHQSHVPVNRTTMANLMNACADRCVALWALLKEELLSQHIVHADETTLQVLKEPMRDAQTNSFMWLYCSAAHATRPVILFEYQETRAGGHPRAFLAGFAHYLQTDGYSGYDSIEGVTRLGYMALCGAASSRRSTRSPGTSIPRRAPHGRSNESPCCTKSKSNSSMPRRKYAGKPGNRSACRS